MEKQGATSMNCGTADRWLGLKWLIWDVPTAWLLNLGTVGIWDLIIPFYEVMPWAL